MVPVALPWRGSTVIRCGRRWAELERYIPHQKPEPTFNSYLWLFESMGTLHRVLAAYEGSVPRSLAATYGPPDTLRRWLSVTQAAVQSDDEATSVALLLRWLVNQLRQQWLPASRLPQQFIHGDVRLGNVCQDNQGQTIYFDFGFLAYRPRVHGLAYALAFMVLALDLHQTPAEFAWESVTWLVEAYEDAAYWRLTEEERRALVPYTAAVPLFAAALDGFSNDPVSQLLSRLPFLRLSEWLLAHPEAMRR
ncbi:phosphotransferase enzyme family protein [Ktedonobacter robiniae]|nr:phosphotransferase [Ktedonobacter robiniae]